MRRRQRINLVITDGSSTTGNDIPRHFNYELSGNPADKNDAPTMTQIKSARDRLNLKGN